MEFVCLFFWFTEMHVAVCGLTFVSGLLFSFQVFIWFWLLLSPVESNALQSATSSLPPFFYPVILIAWQALGLSSPVSTVLEYFILTCKFSRLLGTFCSAALYTLKFIFHATCLYFCCCE